MSEPHTVFVMATICGAVCATTSVFQSIRWWNRFGKTDVVPFHWGVNGWGSWLPARVAMALYPLVLIALGLGGPLLGNALDHVRQHGLPPPSWVHGVNSAATAEELVDGTF